MAAYLCLITIALATRASAESGPTTRPLLEELNRQTTALYQEAQSGIYHLQLPQSKWAHAYAMAWGAAMGCL